MTHPRGSSNSSIVSIVCSAGEIFAAVLVITGTMICTFSDVWTTVPGLVTGVLAVLSTAQYQIYQGYVQKQIGLNSTQALYLMSLPQAYLTLAASVLIETDWTRFTNHSPAVITAKEAKDTDIWGHPYSSGELLIVLCTCVLAVLLNYTTIALIGKTSAVAMQFVNQSKTVLIIAMGFVLFPIKMALGRTLLLMLGLCFVFSGVAWYTYIKNYGPATPGAKTASVTVGVSGGIKGSGASAPQLELGTGISSAHTTTSTNSRTRVPSGHQHSHGIHDGHGHSHGSGSGGRHSSGGHQHDVAMGFAENISGSKVNLHQRTGEPAVSAGGASGMYHPRV
jgi:hypothetical protein